MGYLKELWKLDDDPDGSPAYTPYSFIPINANGPMNMVMGRDWERRDSVMAVSTVDGVIDFLGNSPGPMAQRIMPFSFRAWVNDQNLDAEFDRLMAQIAPGYPQRLVYETDSGGLWFTKGSNPKLQHSVLSANRGADAYLDFTIAWTIRPDWRTRYSELIDIYPSTPVVFAADQHEVYGSRGHVTVTLAQQNFSIDSTGTAGFDLPTIPDYGSRWTFVGPLGGDGGFRIINGVALIKDTTGTRVRMQFDVPFQLPTSNDVAVVYLDRGFFRHNNLPFRPVKPNYQEIYMSVEAGQINTMGIVGLGSGILTGGSITYDWQRKRA